MGLIINKPLPGVNFAQVLSQMEITSPEVADGPGHLSPQVRVHTGGPVEPQRGFVLHSRDYGLPGATLVVDDSCALTATQQVLEDIANGQGPLTALLALGYAGWGPGQLEYEISQNGWLITDADPQIIFGGDHTAKWAAALGLLGIDPVVLSPTAGRA